MQMVIRSKNKMTASLSECDNRIREAKAACRKEVREKLRATSDEYRREASAAIALNVLTVREMKAAKTVMAYCSVGAEPATLALISKLMEAGKTVCLPVCTDLGEDGRRTGSQDAMEARAITGFDDLAHGAYGIPEPKACTALVPPEEIDLVILPCVSCDRSCRRLGHGAGYYDRYLRLVRPDCVKLALCYEAVISDEIPAEPHDVPVDAVISEAAIYRPQPPGGSSEKKTGAPKGEETVHRWRL